MSRVLAALALTTLLTNAAFATDDDVGAWFALAGQGQLGTDPDSRWRWWLDTHFRTFEDSDGFDTSIVRPGIGYRLGEATTFWVGYGWIHTDPVTGSDQNEHRLWQQLTWDAKLGKRELFGFHSRTRFEQRWFNSDGDTGWRFRQLFRIARPLAPGSRWAVRVWDEVFLPINDTDWGARAGFGQNRAFVGLGYTFDQKRNYTLEFGYLNQFINRRSTDLMNHIVSLQLILSF